MNIKYFIPLCCLIFCVSCQSKYANATPDELRRSYMRAYRNDDKAAYKYLLHPDLLAAKDPDIQWSVNKYRDQMFPKPHKVYKLIETKIIEPDPELYDWGMMYCIAI